MNRPRLSPTDYQATYNEYWSRDDRIGESRGDLDRTAEQVVATCGIGSVLDVGSGEGLLVSALLRKGLDARGIDISDVVVARCNQRMPVRFSHGSALDLPFEPESFDVVVSTDCLEHLAPEDVPRALAEMRRVARRAVFLRITTIADREADRQLTMEGRAWWETRCFEAGLRKHAAYYRLNNYEGLNHEASKIAILLEKVPPAAVAKYPLEALAAERGLHMDMLRDTGERSDAHVVRYLWASGFIKPGDRVLDAACGLGYGAHVIAESTGAESVLGIDGSDYAVDYATRSYADGSRVRFESGLLPQALARHADASFDVVVSFETLEHVADPPALLAEFRRLLTPGGRVIVSVPNDWSDESGKDPNPHHLHVYDWARLKRELGEHFIVESATAQTASRCKVHGGKQWAPMPRSLRAVELQEQAPMDCEWWLMSAMKSPLDASAPYRERAFANVNPSGHPSLDYARSYRNPWLMHAMVNVTYRLRNRAELERLASEVMRTSPKDSNDYAAALCVDAYRVLEHGVCSESETQDMLQRIEEAIANPAPGAMGLRWKVSLLFVKAKLLQGMGRLDDARRAFEACGSEDVRPFGIHLATKPTEAWFQAGKLALAGSDAAGARRCWEHGVECGNTLLSASLDEILIDRAFPNRFNYGDGVREYALAWDNIARCANGLHLLSAGERVDDEIIEGSFQHEYASALRALAESLRQSDILKDDLVEVRMLLAERTQRLETAARELVERTDELVETRAVLVERTGLLERASIDLAERTHDLVATRAALAERTELLETSAREVPEVARELVEARRLLAESTARLAQAGAQLDDAAKELDEKRDAQAVTTGQFQAARFELEQRTRELEERTRELEQAREAIAHAERRLAELEIRSSMLERIRSAPIRYAVAEALRRLFGRDR